MLKRRFFLIALNHRSDLTRWLRYGVRIPKQFKKLNSDLRIMSYKIHVFSIDSRLQDSKEMHIKRDYMTTVKVLLYLFPQGKECPHHLFS